MALNPGFGEGWLGGDFSVNLDRAVAGAGGVDGLFSLADLDQKPRAIHQPSPIYSAKVRKKVPGQAVLIFIVNERGRVEQPTVQSSTDPVFEGPALAAVKKWRFEPGKKRGQAVRSRVRIPITFPKK